MTDWYSRPNVAKVEGKYRFRSSAIGGCAVSLAWDLRESIGLDSDLPEQKSFPQNVQIAMDESSALESHVFDLLSDNGWNIEECQDPQFVEFGDCVLEGTVDGRDAEGLFYAEIKTVGTNLYDEIKKSEDLEWHECPPLVQKYRWQVASYNLIYGGAPIYLFVAEKKNGALTGNFYVQQWGDISLPDKREIVDKMALVIEAASQDDLRCVGGELCKWDDRHSRPSVDAKKQLTLLRYAEDRAKQANEEVRKLKEEISSKVQNVGGVAECAGVKLTWVSTHVVEKKPREYDRKYLKITWPNDSVWPKEET